MRVITLATLASLPRARVLGRSLARFQPDWPFEILLVAGEQVVSAAESGPSSPVHSAARELDVDVETLLASHPEEEDLVKLLLPRALQHYAARDVEPVLHLPSSAWVLGDLGPVAAALSNRGVLLIPRMNEHVPSDGLEPSPGQMEWAGRIEETMMAIDPTRGPDGFLGWWAAHVEGTLGSLDGRQSGARPEDRPWLGRFLELAPARFATGVLEDPGCNLNMWNLHGRTLEWGEEEEARVDGSWPLRFLNLPGFDPERPYRLSAIASRVRVSRSPVLHDLCERYAKELLGAGWEDFERREEIGRELVDGLVYDGALRSAYAWALTLGERFGDVFSEQGADLFLRWLEAPAPRGGEHGINRYLFHRVARERPDVMRAYPDLDGDDGPGYVAWCATFGRHELAIPDRFLPRAPRQGASESSPRKPQPDPDSAAARAPAHSSRHAAQPDGGLAVRLTGYLGHTLGLGAAARGYAKALDTVGVPVRTATVPLHHLALPVALEAEYGRHGFQDLVHEGRHGFEIIAVNADELPDFVERLGKDYFEGPRIGIWGWEVNTIPARWQRAFALVEEIWVYSRFMAENIGAAAPVPVIALPPPVEPPPQPASPQRLGVPEGFLFLFIFDYLSTIQRKNPVGLIEAFKRAFAPGEGPQLLIKTINGPLRPLAEEEVMWAAHGREDIHVIDRSLTGEEMQGLMAACDCYVSLHRSEGFGLTLAEAMSIGKPVVATGYSGNVDFMSSENSYLIDYTIVRVGPDCEIYPAEGEWAEPDVEHAARLMREVLADPEHAAAIGTRARADVAERLSAETTGAAMRARLEQLSR
jgi:glycosyltransferase involved in cell wall biosynthesis